MAQERLSLGVQPDDDTQPGGTPIAELFRMVRGTPPLTFREAVAPIEALSIIPRFGHWAGRVVEDARRLKAGRLAECPLNAEEVAAVKAYSAHDTEPPLYKAMNDRCYEPSRQGARPFVAYMWLLHYSLGKLPAFPNGTVYRGVKMSEEIKRAMRAKYNQGTVGSIVMWHGFASCTWEEQVLDDPTFGGRTGQRAIFVIELTQGQARDVSSVSDFAHEREVLLPPGCCFTVLDVSENDQGEVRVNLREVQGDWIQDLRDFEREIRAILEVTKCPYPHRFSVSRDDSRRITGLHFTECHMSPAAAALIVPVVQAMRDLEELRLDSNIEAGSVFPKMLSSCSQLRRLNLGRCHIFFDIAQLLVPALQAMQDLEELYLHWNSFETFGYGDQAERILSDMLSGCKKLKKLSLHRCSISAEAAQRLVPVVQAMQDLEELDLGHNSNIHPPASPKFPQMLSCCTQLRKLNLGGCSMSAEVAHRLVPVVNAMQDLQELHLNFNHDVAEKLPEMLSGCKKLKKLDLIICKISAAIAGLLIPVLQAMQDLEQLVLGVSRDAAEKLPEMLSGCKKLKTLDLYFCSSIGPAAAQLLVPVLQGMEDLEELRLNSSNRGPDEAAEKLPEMLSSCKKLKRLTLESDSTRDCGISTATAQRLGPVFQAMQDLEELDLYYNSKAAVALPEILSSCKKLKKLKLCGLDISAATAQLLVPVIQVMQDLEQLDLPGSPKAAEKLPEMLSCCKKMKKLNLGRCEIGAATAQLLVPVIQAMEDLEELDLRETPQVTSALPDMLSSCKKLKELSLFRCHIDAATAKRLVPALQAMRDLQSLQLETEDKHRIINAGFQHPGVEQIFI